MAPKTKQSNNPEAAASSTHDFKTKAKARIKALEAEVEQIQAGIKSAKEGLQRLHEGLLVKCGELAGLKRLLDDDAKDDKGVKGDEGNTTTSEGETDPA